MAIIIPSKHIYEIRNNKIIENRINKVEVNATEVKPINEFEKLVFSQNIDITDTTALVPSENDIKENSDTAPSGSTFGYLYAYAYFNNKIKTLSSYFKIPKVSKNSRITKLTRFEFSVYGSLTKSKTIGKASVYIKNNDLVFEKQTIDITATNTVEQTFEFPQMPEIVTATKQDLFEQTASVKGVSNPNSYNFIDDTDEYTVYFTCLVSYIKETLLSAGTVSASQSTINSVNGEGEYEYYEPKQLRISVYGDTSGIELTEVKQVYGSDERSVFSIQNNELLQTTNYITYVDNPNSISYNVDKTIKQYTKGKESAVILCSISDYYDQNGNKVIDTNDTTPNPKMLFEEFDLVIPYIFNAKGKDEPMSVDKQNVAKTFVVVGVEPFYDGAVWQRLYLLEKTQEKQT